MAKITEKKLETLRKQMNRSASFLRFEGRCEPDLRFISDGYRVVYLENGSSYSIPDPKEVNERDLSDGMGKFLKDFVSIELSYEAIGKASEFTAINKEVNQIKIAEHYYLNERWFRQLVNFLGKDATVYISKKLWQMVWLKTDDGLAGILPIRIVCSMKEW